MPAMDRVVPEVAEAISDLLIAKGWTVRKLRAQGFGGRAAESLIKPTADSLPRLDTADKALALINRRLWHAKIGPRAPRHPSPE